MGVSDKEVKIAGPISTQNVQKYAMIEMQKFFVHLQMKKNETASKRRGFVLTYEATGNHCASSDFSFV